MDIILITHENLAQDLVKITNSIYKNNNIIFHCLEIKIDHEYCLNHIVYNKARNIITNIKHNNIIIFSDIHGATPDNIARRVAQDYNISLISGLNLAMLIKLVNYSHKGISQQELIELVIDAGKKAIVCKSIEKQSVSHL